MENRLNSLKIDYKDFRMRLFKKAYRFPESNNWDKRKEEYLYLVNRLCLLFMERELATTK